MCASGGSQPATPEAQPVSAAHIAAGNIASGAATHEITTENARARGSPTPSATALYKLTLCAWKRF